MLGEEDRQTEKMAISFNQKGISIITLAFIILIIAFLGLVFTSFLTTSSEESVNEYNSTRALYIAEGGAESAMMHLNQSGASNWLWNDGYIDKPLGDVTVDVEVLQYENQDASLSGSTACESFQSYIEATGDNPARTVYVTLAWSGASSFDLALYSDGSCTTEITAASKIVQSKSISIRYRIPDSAPATLTYSAKVTGTSGQAYELRISHPDEPSPGFTSSDWRAVIALGEMNQAKREVFVAFKK